MIDGLWGHVETSSDSVSAVKIENHHDNNNNGDDDDDKDNNNNNRDDDDKDNDDDDGDKDNDHNNDDDGDNDDDRELVALKEQLVHCKSFCDVDISKACLCAVSRTTNQCCSTKIA
jgi:hypothetical protein